MFARMPRQAEQAECGLVCLAIASELLGAQLDLTELRRRFPTSARGMTLRGIVELATEVDLMGRAVQCPLDELSQLITPAVLHWGLNHFVVLESVSGRHAKIFDPAAGYRKLRLEEVSAKYTGVALELTPAPTFRKRREKSKLNILSLFHLTTDLKIALGQILLLSLFLQAYVIASPFFMKLAIDEAAMKGDRSLLTALGFGFALFGLFNVGATAVRSIALQKVALLINWDMTSRLFHHMLGLPLLWFQRRKLSDTLSRLDSLQPIKNLVTNGIVSSVIDGALSIATLLMMVIFAWPLAFIALAGVVASVLIKVVSVPASLQLSGDTLAATVKEQGKRIETLKAIQTIKALGGERERGGDWAAAFADTIKAGHSSSLNTLLFTSLQSVSEALTTVAIIYFGASAVLDSTMTVGSLYAFMAYRAQFAARSAALFETGMNWKMLSLHSDRVADIALSPAPKGIQAEIALPEMKGALEIHNLAFRYSNYEPPIFSGVNFVAGRGEFIAITGPSGAGKSTLLKVIAGLYPSSTGEVRIDGIPTSAWGERSLRSSIGMVLQDDQLLSGTIAENVAFFAEDLDMDRVRECLNAAGIGNEISAMPMQTETLVGDMGAALSGGQRQRVLLARALYRKPKILILDEATSHLDVPREKEINAVIRDLEITRIIVAHRDETVNAADRVLVLERGRLIERTTTTQGKSFGDRLSAAMAANSIATESTAV